MTLHRVRVGRPVRPLVPALVATLAAACVNDRIPTENQQIPVRVEALKVSVLEPLSTDMPVLIGSSTHIESVPPECFTVSASGTGAIEERTLTIQAEGDVRIELEPQPCDRLEGHGADGLTLRAIPGGQVEPIYLRPQEKVGAEAHQAAEVEVFGDVQGVLPYVDHPAGEPIRVLEGVRVTLTIGLRAGDQWAMVGPGGGQLVVDGPVAESHELQPLTVAFVPQPGAEGELRFVGLDFDLPVATWRAVPASDLVELRVAGVHLEEDGTPLLGLTSVALDGQGRRIVGVPVRWSSADPTETQEPDVRDGAFVYMPGICARARHRDQERSITLDATFEHLTAAITTEVFLPAVDIDDAEVDEFCGPLPDEEQPDDEEQPHDDGPAPVDGGCGCTSATNGASGASGFALLLGLLALRRRAPKNGPKSP